MAKNKKPKFLEKETPDLLVMLKEILDATSILFPKTQNCHRERG